MTEEMMKLDIYMNRYTTINNAVSYVQFHILERDYDDMKLYTHVTSPLRHNPKFV